MTKAKHAAVREPIRHSGFVILSVFVKNVAAFVNGADVSGHSN